MPHGEHRSAFDARRTVADYPIELLAQLRDNIGNAVGGECFLVAGLRSREQPQCIETLVADQRLRKFDGTLDHIDEVEYHPSFGAHHEIEIAQADVEIDHGHGLSGLSECCAKGSG